MPEEERVRLALDVELSKGGADYAVTLITAGDTLHGWRFPAEVLRRSTARFEGASSFLDHVWFGAQKVGNLVGVIAGVMWSEPAEALRGSLRLAKTPTAEWVSTMIEQIIKDRGQGLPVPNVGLSADLFCGFHLDGRVRVVDEIRSVYSMDVVFYPASGGAFDRVLNSVRGGIEMPGEEERVAEEGGVQPGRNLGGGGGELALPEPVVEPAAVSEETAAGGVQGAVPPGGELVSQEAAAEQAQALLRAQCATVLDGALAWCELPQPMKDAVRARFSGHVFAPETLDAEIERYRSMLAGMLEPGVIQGVGEAADGGRISGMLDGMDRLQLAFDRLMGLPLADADSDVRRLSGIRELYLMMTGDHDFYGQFYPERVQLANVTTSSMTSVVKNALNKVLLAAYNVRPQWWDRLCYHEEFGTLNQITWMKTGGFGTLPTVGEGAAYTELDWSDAEETASFLKKGGYIGITLEMIDRDDVGSVRRIPRELGNAAWRTLSALVSALFTDNSGTGPAMADTYNVFDATNHSNLLTTALSAGAWDAVIQAIFQQTEPTSSAVLAIRPKFILVPIELEKTALEILQQPWSTADNKHYLDPRYLSSEVIVVPEWTDANDWAAACDPLDCPGICIGYRYGRAPELFVADDQVVGSMFTNDEMRIKVRFFVAVGVADHRPLHKSNVA